MKFYLCYPYMLFKKRDQQKSYTPLPAWLKENRLYNLKQIFMRINLVLFFIAIAMFKVTASVKAQTINLKFENAPLEKVFNAIEKQSGYIFWYKKELLKTASKVNLKITNGNIKEALDQCFKNQPLEYQIVENTIVVKPKIKVKQEFQILKSIPVKGKVLDSKKQPLPGVSIKVKGTGNSVVSNNDGEFTIDVADENAVLIISYLGMETLEVAVKQNLTPSIILKESTSQLEGVTVVNTGYQQIPKERATGSFVQIDNELYNRRVSTNFLDRLDGIASGLIFNKSLSNNGSSPRNETAGIAIRGRSTIDAKVSADPLIVIDNFPYEGNLENINPNDIESITILKDAAAASIWGARSGNGVIVITTKKGKFGQPLKVEFNSNVTIGQKPDLYYSKNYLESPQYIEIETYLFNQGSYNSNLNNTTTFPFLSPVVEILAKKRAGTLSATEADAQLNSLGGKDVRAQLGQYFNRNSTRQQYSINLNGGSEKVSYNFSAGYDDNQYERYDGYSRFNITAANIYRPVRNLEITTGLILTRAKDIRSFIYNPSFPYIRIADEAGNPLVVPFGYRDSFIQNSNNLGFLDWQYRPLEEKDLVDNSVKTASTILKASVKYNFLSHFNISVQYQFENQNTDGRNLQGMDTYFTRNSINRYAQRSATGVFTYPLPKGGILTSTQSELNSHNLRTQFNYAHNIDPDHSISALAGAELREIVSEGSFNTAYGYDDDLGTSVTNLNYAGTFPSNPSGLGSIALPLPDGNYTGRTNRYVSYYANVAYTFKEKYTFSLSGRKDGANIFGVRTNDKITPLWSTGLLWSINKEDFYKLSFLPKLVFRATYGYNGNVYNASAYLTATYRTNGINGNQFATITSPPNSELRWEKIRNINLGLDFASKGNIISGSVELFQKYATDLIEDAILAPSSGFITYKGNAASLKTEGLDLTLNSNNLKGKLKWSTSLISSFQKDRIVHYDTKYTALNLARFDQTVEPASNGIFPIEGNSLFGVYSYRSAGLDPANGDPLGYLNGVVSKDYTSIVNNTAITDLVYHGSSRPNIFGAFRNTFEYSGISLSLNVTYKFDYYFRRRSINLNYTQLLSGSGSPHTDYNDRWQKPGDELSTTVPSLVFAVNTNRNLFYRSSDVLVEKGDHIRFQDISLGYDLAKRLWKKSPFRSLQLFSYVNNIGIIWRANKLGLDPDVMDLSLYSFPRARTIAFGIKGQFN